MARLPGALELSAHTSDRLTDRISIGVLARVVPRDLVDEVLAETKRQEKRSRLLPARVVVYFAMAMCLFFDDDYEEVMRRLVGTLRWLGSWKGDWKVPSTGAISQARARLGPEPLKLLFERVAVPVAGLGTRGAWLASRRLVAVDGVHLDVADTPENLDAFGRFSNGPKTAAFPQVHVVALGNWIRDQAHYRCRFPNEYGLANQISHPANVYLREKTLIEPIDDWLFTRFAPHNVTETIRAISRHQTDPNIEDPQLASAQREIAECDRRLVRYRATLDAGGDEMTIAGWITETQANAKSRLPASPRPSPDANVT